MSMVGMSLPRWMRSNLDPFRSTMRKHGHSSSKMVITMRMKMDGTSRSSFGGNGTRALRKCGGVMMGRRGGCIWAELPEKEKDSAEASSSTAKAPDMAVNEEDEPIWVRRERERELQKKEGKDLPFAVYLLSSAIVAIAAIGSIFEYANKNPIFDVIESDSPFYGPILGLFAFTGLPTSAYLFYRSIQAANKEAERMDKLDGY